MATTSCSFGIYHPTVVPTNFRRDDHDERADGDEPDDGDGSEEAQDRDGRVVAP